MESARCFEPGRDHRELTRFVPVGVSLLCTIPLDIVFVVVSAMMLNDYMKNRPGQFR